MDLTRKASLKTIQQNGLEKKKRSVETATLEDVTPEKKSWGQIWREYPKSVVFIFGNEFCERFSYYGMKAVLTLYLVNILKFSRNTATALYSGFGMLCYFSPILGSILADGYIGKFHTIMWISLFYAAGNVTIAVAASFAEGATVHPWLDFIGLIIIGLGTGGIKPCVQPFGGDQFRKGQERELAQFFSIFYFAINAGSTISILLTPIFRTTPCQNQTTCYPLAFGIPAALMVVAVIFFALGSYWYKKVPPQGNVFAKVAKVVGTALNNKRTFEIKREHWLDHYMDSHSCACDEECRDSGKCAKAQFVSDIKAVLRVLIVYVPLPIFWALYEQQGSTWVLQATQMNPEIAKNTYFLPDQMGVLNAVLIMALIPIFSLGIYPLVGKCVKVTPLRKMSIGCFLAGVAYIVCMLIQMQITPTLPPYPAKGETLLQVTNYVHGCSSINFVGRAGNKVVVNETLKTNEEKLLHIYDRQITWEYYQVSDACAWVGKQPKDQKTDLPANKAGYVIFTDLYSDTTFLDTKMDKSDSGEAVFTMNVNYYADNITEQVPAEFKIALCKDKEDSCEKSKDQNVYMEFKIGEIQDRTSKYADLKSGTWGAFLVRNDSFDPEPLNISFTQAKLGGIFSLTIFTNPNPSGEDKFLGEKLRQSPDNELSILWQIPQYFVISVAEILFSITGYEFAYSQAPHSMKSVVFALYLLTDAVGNVIILIISSVSTAGFDMAWIFLIYACLMFVVFVIFIFIAIKYKYTLYVQGDADDHKKGKDKSST